MTPEKPSWKLPLDLRPADFIHVGTVAVALIVFVVKTDQRISNLEKATSYLTDFAEASDGYHSALTGVQFKGGRPIDGMLSYFKKESAR